MNISVGTAIPPRPEYDEFIDSQVILLNTIHFILEHAMYL